MRNFPRGPNALVPRSIGTGMLGAGWAGGGDGSYVQRSAQQVPIPPLVD